MASPEQAASSSIKALLKGTTPRHLRQPPAAAAAAQGSISCNAQRLLAAAARDGPMAGHSFDKEAWQARPPARPAAPPSRRAALPGSSTAGRRGDLLGRAVGAWWGSPSLVGSAARVQETIYIVRTQGGNQKQCSSALAT